MRPQPSPDVSRLWCRSRHQRQGQAAYSHRSRANALEHRRSRAFGRHHANDFAVRTVMTNVRPRELDISRFGNPNASRLQGLSIRNSGWKAGSAKSKKALGAPSSIVPKKLQPQYWQVSLVPFGRNQGRVSAAMAASRCATMVLRAHPARFRQWFGRGEAAAQSRAWAARSRTALEARSQPRREPSSRRRERPYPLARPLDGGRAR
jgi:hypothetical protein